MIKFKNKIFIRCSALLFAVLLSVFCFIAFLPRKNIAHAASVVGTYDYTFNDFNIPWNTRFELGSGADSYLNTMVDYSISFDWSVSSQNPMDAKFNLSVFFNTIFENFEVTDGYNFRLVPYSLGSTDDIINNHWSCFSVQGAYNGDNGGSFVTNFRHVGTTTFLGGYTVSTVDQNNTLVLRRRINETLLNPFEVSAHPLYFPYRFVSKAMTNYSEITMLTINYNARFKLDTSNKKMDIKIPSNSSFYFIPTALITYTFSNTDKSSYFSLTIPTWLGSSNWTNTYYLGNVDLGSFSYNEGYEAGRDSGFTDGFNKGNSEGFESGYSQGKTEGYNSGYSAGVADSNEFTFNSLISAVFDAPITTIGGMLDFTILGVNIKQFVFSLFSICLVVALVRLVM